ncbi:MAG: GNAT family N-acetyltransferase [Gammaproteobacteria bacterium]|nr:GNAT family N-acetyltransferase [Gammaproteobacteria bacterium]
MVVTANTKEQLNAMTRLMYQGAGVKPSEDLTMIGWVNQSDEKLVMVVGFNSQVGKTCRIHVSMADGFSFTPRAMLKAVFSYAFDLAGCEMLIGIVNSNNERALRYDLHLGFEESIRFPGVHDDGGDIVVLTMKRSQCKYLDIKEAA